MRIVALLALTALLSAQQTRREITNPSRDPVDDTKPNSDAVPDVYAVKGDIERVLVLRFKYQTDLLAGIEKMVKQNNIKNAVILSAYGSVRNYHLHVVSNRTLPSKNLFVKDPTAPADIIGMSGFITDGAIHAHMTLASGDKAFGGHLEPGTEVFTFAVMTIGVFGSDVDLKHLDDKGYR